MKTDYLEENKILPKNFQKKNGNNHTEYKALQKYIRCK